MLNANTGERRTIRDDKTVTSAQIAALAQMKANFVFEGKRYYSLGSATFDPATHEVAYYMETCE